MSDGLILFLDSIEGLESINPTSLDILSKYKAGNTGTNVIIADNESFGVIIDQVGLRIVEFVPVYFYREITDTDSNPVTNIKSIPAE